MADQVVMAEHEQPKDTMGGMGVQQVKCQLPSCKTMTVRAANPRHGTLHSVNFAENHVGGDCSDNDNDGNDVDSDDDGKLRGDMMKVTMMMLSRCSG